MNKEEIKKLNFTKNVTVIADNHLHYRDHTDIPALLSRITEKFHNEKDERLTLLWSICGFALSQNLLLKQSRDREKQYEQIVASYEMKLAEYRGEMQ